MGNMPSDHDPGMSVSRKSTWSVTSSDYGPAFNEYRETITENGVTKVRYHTSRDAYQGSGSGRNPLHHDYRHPQGDRPPVFGGSGPERGRVVRREDGDFLNGQGGKPLPEARGQHRAPPPWHWDDGREPPLSGGGGGGGGPSAKGAPPSGPSQGDRGKRPGGDNPRPLPQPSSRREGHPPPPPPYTPHAYPQSGNEAPFPFFDGADPRVNPQQRSHPNPLLLSDTDPTDPCSGGSRDRGIASGRPLGPKGVVKMERDTSYRTRKAETARYMIRSDQESDMKRMDITKGILNDLTRR